jgi:hypothetical protein
MPWCLPISVWQGLQQLQQHLPFLWQRQLRERRQNVLLLWVEKQYALQRCIFRI